MSLSTFERLVITGFGAVFLFLGGLGAYMVRELRSPMPTPLVAAAEVVTNTPVDEPRASATVTFSATPSPSPSPTASRTATETLTSTTTPTATSTPTPTSSPTPTATEVPGWTYADFGPYLQSVTDDSVIVAWQTRKSSVGEVVFGESSDYSEGVSEDGGRRWHNVKLTGLKPYTVYHYRVYNDGKPMGGDLTFRSGAAAGQDSFDFVVYGDTQHHPEIQASVAERALKQDPDFFLHTGDLVNDGRSSDDWHDFFDLAGPLLARAPLFPTLGNHERRSEYYFDLFYLPGGERWYTFTYAEARFISLRVDEETGFEEGTAQHDWLKSTLKSNKLPWVVVFFHRSPYTSEYEGSEEVAIREALTPLFEAYGVDLVLSGHNHNYQRSEADGITYLVTGGGGGNLSSSVEPDEYLVTYEIAYHLLYIRVEGDTLTVRAMEPDGETIDSFSLGPP